MQETQRRGRALVFIYLSEGVLFQTSTSLAVYSSVGSRLEAPAVIFPPPSDAP